MLYIQRQNDANPDENGKDVTVMDDENPGVMRTT